MSNFDDEIRTINDKLSRLFANASLIKFCYSGIYTLEFDLPEKIYGFNYFFLDIGTEISIFEADNQTQVLKNFSIEDFFLIWSENVVKVLVESDLTLSIFFENNYCCKVASKMFDPENLFDMRWSIYQKQGVPSFYLMVSGENDFYLDTP